MLQEEQSVSFDPMYVCYGGPPWYTRLLSLYLLAALVLLLWRVASFLGNLWILRASNAVHLDPARVYARIDSAIARIRTLKNLSLFTVLLVIANLALNMADALIQVCTQKTSAFRAVAGSFAVSLQDFAVGILICAGLFAAAWLFESLFTRRKRRLASPNPSPGLN